MKIPKRRKKTSASKTVVLLAFYMALMDYSTALPVSWLEKACKSKVCCSRYINELKELIFGDSLFYEVDVEDKDGKDWITQKKVRVYKSKEIGVAESFRENPVYRFDEVISRGVTPNKKAHIERLQRLITLYDKLDDYPDFDLYEYKSEGYNGRAGYIDEDGYEVWNPFPDAKDFFRFVENDYDGLTLRTLQRDLKDIKNAIYLYGKIMNQF